jgi:hypothetical protein
MQAGEMRDSGGQPQRPGFDFRIPGERRQSRDTTFRSLQQEEFPRLGDEPPRRTDGKISGFWGWSILLVPVLLLMAFAFIPGAESDEGDAAGDDSGVGVFLALWFGPYIAGAIAAFRGNRRGITWTFPWTCLILLLIITIPFTEPAGVWLFGFLGIGLSGFLLHLTARHLTRDRSTPNATPVPGASYS